MFWPQLRASYRLLGLFTFMVWFSASVFAEDGRAASQADTARLDPAWKAATTAALHGPNTVNLRDQAQIALSEGYRFIPSKEAAPVMERMGRQTGDTFLGLLLPENGDWFATLDFEFAGYIKDDEARDWNTDAMLTTIKEETLADNRRRREKGIPPFEVTRWIEVPTYDPETHRLLWSTEVRELDGNDSDPSVAYQIYVLGRDGYISLQLMTAASKIEAGKRVAQELLRSISYYSGKRYSDFDSSTDKVAAYGLTALVDVTKKQSALPAMFRMFSPKFLKLSLLIVVLAALAMVLKNYRNANLSVRSR